MDNDQPHELKGQIFWCIKPSSESESYGDGGPSEPWMGKIVRWYGNTWFYMCRFDAATGEPDLDSNACCMVQVDDMHKTEIAAWQAYRRSIAVEIARLNTSLLKTTDKIRLLACSQNLVRLEDTTMPIAGVYRCCRQSVGCEFDGFIPLLAESTCNKCQRVFVLTGDISAPIWKPKT